MLTQSGQRVPLVVRGIVTDNARLLADLTITLALARSRVRAAHRRRRLRRLRAGRHRPPGPAGGRPAARRALPPGESQTAAQFKASRPRMVNSLLAFIYVLLALSVIVSLFGIVNTLVLSIYERTRELGMLRAIGTTRRQIREMVRYESIITALIGGVLGIALGIALALILDATVLSGTGFVLVIPVGRCRAVRPRRLSPACSPPRGPRGAPRASTSSRRSRRSDGRDGRSGPERPRDHHLLHLVGPLADREDLRVAVEAADRVLLDVAVAAVDLHRLLGARTASRPLLSFAWAAVSVKSRPRSFRHAAL